MSFPTDRAGLEQEIQKCEVAVRDTVDGKDPATVRKRGIALWRLGEVLFRLDRFHESAECLQEAVSTLRNVPSLRWLLTLAIIKRSNALAATNRDLESLQLLDEAIEPGATAPHMPDMIPIAVGLRMFTLERLGQQDRAYAAAESVINELDPGETQTQRSLVVSAFTVQGRVARSRGDTHQALAKIGEALKRCSNEDETAFFAAPLSDAMIARASVLEELGRVDEALEAYDAILRRLGKTPDASALSAVARAHERTAGLLPQADATVR